jgi:uncharacterized protein (DUF1778 family)
VVDVVVLHRRDVVEYAHLATYGGSPYTGIMAIAKEAKSERLELRVTPSAKEMIARATALSGLAPGDLAYEAARRIIEEQEVMTLRDADREAFLRSLNRSPKAATGLVAALRQHRKLTK